MPLCYPLYFALLNDNIRNRNVDSTIMNGMQEKRRQRKGHAIRTDDNSVTKIGLNIKSE